MDRSMKWFYEQRCQAVVKALEHNRFNAYYAADKAAAVAQTMELINEGASVAFGGSMTMLESGLVNALRKFNCTLYDRNRLGTTAEEIKAMAPKFFSVDFFLASANAVTEDGQLLFVDGANTRIAPVLFGPANVILVVGANKIATDAVAAQEHMRRIACPVNAKRLNRNTPCTADGLCRDCHSPERICNSTLILHKHSSWEEDHKMHVIMVAESLGF